MGKKITKLTAAQEKALPECREMWRAYGLSTERADRAKAEAAQVRPPALRVRVDGLIVDNFAGGGGASTGLEEATGRSPDYAINHDAEALALHAANHPKTKHLREDVWDVDPAALCAGRPVALAWFSPDCTYHSRARGGKPFRERDKAKRRRGLAWVVTRWAKAVRPRLIVCENVKEFEDWGPLRDDGTPDPARAGFTFRRWVARMENLGYRVSWRILRACDYGAPTSRARLFIIASLDDEPAWPQATHGAGTGVPYRTAAECIDWTIPCPSIFDRSRPLADATLRRIARGIQRYVIGAAQPFIVPVKTWGGGGNDPRSLDEPMRTITRSKRGEFALVAPSLIQTGYGERRGQEPRALDIGRPLGTVVGGGAKHALVAAFLARHYGGHENDGAQLTIPLHTITTQDHHALVASHLIKFQQNSVGQDPREPLHTVMAGATRFAEVRAFLMAYYGTDQAAQLRLPMPTATTRDRFALVTVQGQEYVIADIGMRMLSPRELYNAQGFPASYVIDPEFNGKPLTKTAQIACCGNSVPPPFSRAIAAANLRAPERRTEAA